jgi:hypothetical protein
MYTSTSTPLSQDAICLGGVASLEQKGPAMFHGLSADAPTRRHLRHWERVCLYLESQPYRAVRFPYPKDPPITTRLLKRMARFDLVRHLEDCSWQLSIRWRSKLKHLWEGTQEEDTLSPEERGPTAPFVASRQVDTLYVNLFAEALPKHLQEQCAELKAQAQAVDQPVETPWHIFDAPLSMWKAGVGTSQKNHGVSWSFLLRNAYVMLRLRKTPLKQLVGSIRFSAECLWTHGGVTSLDEVKRTLQAMWEEPAEGESPAPAGTAFEKVVWQLSQLHPCADIANFSPEPVDLERFVTHARKKAIHIPSMGEVNAALQGDGDEVDLDAFLAEMPEEWADLPLPFFADEVGLPLELLDLDTQDDELDDEEVLPVDASGAAVYLWGRRASGFAFAPGAPMSAAIYDKALEEKRSGKRWMEAYHRAGGWTLAMPLTRVEGRFTREVLREISAALGLESWDWCDDPWMALSHLNDFWGYFVGLPPEHDHAPDVTHRGWLRLTMPQEDANRSRWPTDPVWEVVQRVRFGGAAPQPLARAKRSDPQLEQVDAELYGLFKLRSVLSSRHQVEGATLSLELGAFAQAMEAKDLDEQRDYAEEIREKARMLGKPVPKREPMLASQQPASHNSHIEQGVR